MGDVLVFFCVYNVCGPNVCECVCVLRLADLCVCELSQSQHQLKEGTPYLRSALGVSGFVMVCVGVACF